MNLFVTNVSSTIGFGHLSRTLAIASYFKKKDNFLFIKGSKNIDLKNKKLFSKIHSNTNKNLLKKLKFYLKNKSKKKAHIFIDDYKLPLNILRKICSLNASIIEHIPKKRINNLYSDISICLSPEKFKSSKNILLSGIKYFVLDKRKFNKKNSKKKQNKIIISLGGGTDKNCIRKIIQNLISAESRIKNVHIYTTRLNQLNKMNKKFIKKMNLKNKMSIKYFINEKNFIDKLKTCNLLITTPGITFLEASYLKIPTLALSFNKTQEEHIKSFPSYKKIYIGNFKKINFYKLNKLIKKIFSKKIKMKNIVNSVDKFGFKRILNEIKKFNA